LEVTWPTVVLIDLFIDHATVELGVHFQQRGQDLQYYKKAFEGDLLLETKNYYINESMEFFRQNSVAEYLKKVYMFISTLKEGISVYINILRIYFNIISISDATVWKFESRFGFQFSSSGNRGFNFQTKKSIFFVENLKPNMWFRFLVSVWK